MSAGADAAGRLLNEAHRALTEMESPATEVTAALRLAHSTNPSTGVRKVLRRDERHGGKR